MQKEETMGGEALRISHEAELVLKGKDGLVSIYRLEISAWANPISLQ